MARPAASSDWTESDWAEYHAEGRGLALDEEDRVQRRGFGGFGGAPTQSVETSRAIQAQAKREHLLALTPSWAKQRAEFELARDPGADLDTLRQRVAAKLPPAPELPLGERHRTLAEVDDDLFTRSLQAAFGGVPSPASPPETRPEPHQRGAASPRSGPPRSLADVDDDLFARSLRGI